LTTKAYLTMAKQQKQTTSPRGDDHREDDSDRSVDETETPNDDDHRPKEHDMMKEETPSAVAPFVSDGKYRNKQRCLVLCLRGATARYRHLLEDIRVLLPHHKKESKLDPGNGGMAAAVNDIAEMRSCNTVVFMECRKRQDAYLWVGNVGQNRGPSAKFHLTNVHTMDELRLTGNCMKGSRPILTFDESFDRLGHLKLLKEMFTDVFGTPRGHPKSKPFVDRVMAFYYADKKVRPIWILLVGLPQAVVGTPIPFV
jgi:Brix domain